MFQSDNGAFDFYFNAKKETVELARELRQKMTPAEKVLWDKLRNKQLLGFKFRRQHPVEIFVVDFICIEKLLAIEVDGDIHLTGEQQEWDENRTVEIEKYGIEIVRFTNDQVINKTSEVLEEIKKLLISR
jgi:very-short-patch-repair endonuclease